jgi:hypothetical protein
LVGGDPSHGTSPGSGAIVGSIAWTGGAPDKTARLAYLLARYEQTTDASVAASVSQFARGEYHAGIPVSHQGVYDALAAEAKRNGGPRAALVEVDAGNLKVWWGLVRQGETDRAGAHYADGFTATLRITTANATFADGSQTMTATTGTAVKQAALKPRHPLTADEPVAVQLTVTGVPRDSKRARACRLLVVLVWPVCAAWR